MPARVVFLNMNGQINRVICKYNFSGSADKSIVGGRGKSVFSLKSEQIHKSAGDACRGEFRSFGGISVLLGVFARAMRGRGRGETFAHENTVLNDPRGRENALK